MFQNDIFGYKRNPKPRGVFSTENSTLIFGSPGQGGQVNPVGYLVQSWNMNYTQDVQELFEIGSNELYWAKGRPVGQGTISRVIGEADVDNQNSGFFPSDAYDICKGGASLELTARGGSCENYPLKSVKITMAGVLVTGIGFSMAVGDVRLIENFGWRFAYLEVSTQTQAAA